MNSDWYEKPPSAEDLRLAATRIAQAAAVFDGLPANDNRHMALVVALHSASAIADQLDDEARRAERVA